MQRPIDTVSAFIGKCLPYGTLKNFGPFSWIAPFYHAVSDVPLIHIRHLYRHKNVQEFTADLDFLLKHYTPVDLKQFKEIVNNPAHNKTNTFLLSFDDGLREFHDIIAPILLRKGIPAVCFLNSDFIDNRNLFFRYKASIIFDHFTKSDNWHKSADIISWFRTNRQAGDKTIFDTLLSLKYHQKNALDVLASLCDISFAEYLKKYQPYLTTAQISKLTKDGFIFGAHSCDHPEFRFIAPEDQIRQTLESINYVQKHLYQRDKIFSFPFTDFGVTSSFFTHILEEEKVADLLFGCAGFKTCCVPGHIQRIPMEHHHWTAEKILQAETVNYRIKKCLGKDKMYYS